MATQLSGEGTTELTEANVILQQIMEPSNAMPCPVPISLIRDLKVPRPIVNKRPLQLALNMGREDEKKFYHLRENSIKCHVTLKFYSSVLPQRQCNCYLDFREIV